MADLEELAGRVEELLGPDREVDAEIEKLLPCSDEFAQHHPGKPMSRWNENAFQFYSLGDEGHEYRSPPYTASIDAAMTLAPDDWYRIEQQETRDGAWARVTTLDAKGYAPMVEAHATTAARALTAAFLRARTQGNQNG